jgi:hypothetical protein
MKPFPLRTVRQGCRQICQSEAEAPPPVALSIRVSNDKRAYLACIAGHRSIAAYVREKALGSEQSHWRKVAANPSLDHAMLGQVLGKLGKSDQVQPLTGELLCDWTGNTRRSTVRPAATICA